MVRHTVAPITKGENTMQFLKAFFEFIVVTAVFLLLLLVMSLAMPENARADEDICEGIHMFAASVMAARQKGVSIVDIRQVVSESTDIDSTRDLMLTVITKAYEMPRFSTTEYKIEAVKDFANDMTTKCYRQLHR